MKTDGQNYLDGLGDCSHNGFDRRFSKISISLGLGNNMIERELRLLFKATLYATLCNIAFNGLGGCDGQIKPGREAHRINLEHKYMVARDGWFESAGWDALPELTRESIRKIFLNVYVTEDNLAG
jgi:hypothetical protein